MARKPRNEEFTTITFKTTENEFSPEALKKIRAFFLAQGSKQNTLGLMTQFFIEHVGNIDLTSYEGMKALTHSGLAAKLQEQFLGISHVPSATDQVAEEQANDYTEQMIDPPPHEPQSTIQPTASQPAKKDDSSELPGREAF